MVKGSFETIIIQSQTVGFHTALGVLDWKTMQKLICLLKQSFSFILSKVYLLSAAVKN